MNRFKSIQDMNNYIVSIKKRQEEIFRELDQYNSLLVGFFDPERKKIKEKKKALNLGLKIAKANIQYVNSLYEKYTTFESSIFLNFLREYLSIKENEPYELMLDVEEDNFVMAIATKTYPMNIFGNKYNIITTSSNKQKLENKNSRGQCGGDTDDIDDYLSICKDQKYICLKTANKYSLLAGPNLYKCYEKYPYFLDLACMLIDLKLKNPSLSDEDRLNMVLDSIKPTKSTNIVPKWKL